MEELDVNKGKSNGNNNNNANPNAGALVPRSGDGKASAAVVEVASRRAVDVSSAADDQSDEEIRPNLFQEYIRKMALEEGMGNFNMAFFKQSGDPRKTLGKIQALDAQIAGLQQQLAGLELQRRQQMEKLGQQLEKSNPVENIKNVKGFGKK